MDSQNVLSVLARKLRADTLLSREDQEAVFALPIRRQTLEDGVDIAREGERPGRACILLTAYAFSHKTTSDGRRQVLAFHVPGEMPDVQSLNLKVMDETLTTLATGEVAFIDHGDLRAVCHRHPSLADAFWRETLIEGAIQREWTLNVGQREGASRVAHLLCEWFVRVGAVGLATNGGCRFPVTQNELANAVGFTPVHVNRMLQELRGAGLIRLAGGRLEILDWPALSTLADFDPRYLHLDPDETLGA